MCDRCVDVKTGLYWLGSHELLFLIKVFVANILEVHESKIISKMQQEEVEGIE